MDTTDLIWGSLLAAGLAYEAYALLNTRDGDTLSERTRHWLHVHTRPGRALFALLWSTFSVWFLVHILGG